MTWSELSYRLLAINERKENEVALQSALKGIKYSPKKFRKEKVDYKIDPALEEKIRLAMDNSIKNKNLKLGKINGNK